MDIIGSLLAAVLAIATALISQVQAVLLLIPLIFLGLIISLVIAILEIENTYWMIQERTESPAKTFTLFPYLPREIQGMVWRAAAMAPTTVGIKEAYSDLNYTWYATFGFLGAIRGVCREANRQALTCRLPQYIGKDANSVLEKRGFDTIWLMEVSCVKFIDDYWLATDGEDDIPRKLAMPLSTWKFQIVGLPIRQLIIRLRRWRIRELFLVVYHEDPEDTLIQFIEPKKSPIAMQITFNFGLETARSCSTWPDYEHLSVAGLIAVNGTDVIENEKYYLEGKPVPVPLLMRNWKLESNTRFLGCGVNGLLPEFDVLKQNLSDEIPEFRIDMTWYGGW
ncbi:hypothetical protein EG329_013818 [Mollisiaceae sp. DMI_Dod_QoI]|nr:hypothetical protein EG329_013818 [Helotiales sp. DMI_Dod_QoI]